MIGRTNQFRKFVPIKSAGRYRQPMNYEKPQTRVQTACHQSKNRQRTLTTHEAVNKYFREIRGNYQSPQNIASNKGSRRNIQKGSPIPCFYDQENTNNIFVGVDTHKFQDEDMINKNSQQSMKVKLSHGSNSLVETRIRQVERSASRGSNSSGKGQMKGFFERKQRFEQELQQAQ